MLLTGMNRPAEVCGLRRNLYTPPVVYHSGGYTGLGGKYQPAGIFHKGEYVLPAC